MEEVCRWAGASGGLVGEEEVAGVGGHGGQRELGWLCAWRCKQKDRGWRGAWVGPPRQNSQKTRGPFRDGPYMPVFIAPLGNLYSGT